MIICPGMALWATCSSRELHTLLPVFTIKLSSGELSVYPGASGSTCCGICYKIQSPVLKKAGGAFSKLVAEVVTIVKEKIVYLWIFFLHFMIDGKRDIPIFQSQIIKSR